MNDLLLLRMRVALTRDEGKVAKLYHDAKGLPTIGIGHNLAARGLTDDVIEMIFEDDLEDTERELMVAVPLYNTLTPARQGALLNMAFTMGVSGVMTFAHLLAALSIHDYAASAAAVRASVWATSQAPERAARVATQLEEDRWV